MGNLFRNGSLEKNPIRAVRKSAVQFTGQQQKLDHSWMFGRYTRSPVQQSRVSKPIVSRGRCLAETSRPQPPYKSAGGTRSGYLFSSCFFIVYNYLVDCHQQSTMLLA